MDVNSFQNLELIPKLLHKMEKMERELKDLQDKKISDFIDLSKKSNIALYLGKSVRTIDRYIENGTFKVGIHYLNQDNGKIHFIDREIVAFKQKGTK